MRLHRPVVVSLSISRALVQQELQRQKQVRRMHFDGPVQHAPSQRCDTPAAANRTTLSSGFFTVLKNGSEFWRACGRVCGADAARASAALCVFVCANVLLTSLHVRLLQARVAAWP